MFINRLNQLYKPDRILYYIDANDEALDAFYSGKLCSELEPYAGAFGTYDRPGVFFLRSLKKEVIGIEYRIRDERIKYPQGLKSISLPGAFYYAVEIDHVDKPDMEFIESLFNIISADNDAHRTHSDLLFKKKSEVIGIFVANDKLLMQYEMDLDRDLAFNIIDNNPSEFDKNELYLMAFTDPVTGHYNWNHLTAYLEMPMDAGINDYAFVHFDVKEFRVINEVFGHAVADRLLRNIVKEMKAADFVYASGRCHNDNFAMLIHDMPEEETRSKLEAFFDRLSYIKDFPDFKVYYRCGVVPMRRAMLLGDRVADAGKMAQNLGQNPNQTDIIYFTDKMHDDILWGNNIKAYLGQAVENDEFLVFLQPKFNIHTEKICGAEALVRWNYKSSQMIPPYRFIPFFEKDGSIGIVDDIVLNKVCRVLEKWKKEGRPLYPISINLSRARLYQPDLTQHLTEIVDTYGVEHSLIDFELTESAAYDNRERMIDVMSELKSKGFGISMDDFGTGYSALSLLTDMPFNTLKIDKSFVDKIGIGGEKEQDIIVLGYIISLFKDLHLHCLAEGAEQKSQVDRLRTLGCEIIQGYYYSKPIPLDDYEKKYLT